MKLKLTANKKEYQQKWYQKNREEHIKKVLEYKKTNPEKVNKWGRDWYELNKRKMLFYQRKRKYNIDESQWNKLFESQNYCCAICKKKDPGGTGVWHTDHDHRTGLVRGILCVKCNRTLHKELTVEMLYVIIKYISK